jgi:hypothetical protein
MHNLSLLIKWLLKAWPFLFVAIIGGIERQIDECRQLVFVKEKEIKLSIDRVKQELRTEISTNSAKIQDVTTLMDGSVIGGFKMQLFGVFLVIYGAVLGVF